MWYGTKHNSDKLTTQMLQITGSTVIFHIQFNEIAE